MRHKVVRISNTKKKTKTIHESEAVGSLCFGYGNLFSAQRNTDNEAEGQFVEKLPNEISVNSIIQV